MSFQHILYTSSDGIARLTLNRPDKLNSFTAPMHEEVQAALALVRDDRSVRVLLLTGAGRAFCAGQDLADPTVDPRQGNTDLGASIERYYAPLVLALRSLALPVVCAVNGVAAGAGANLAFACDLVIARRSAVFIQSFAKLGLVPDTGGTYFLPRLAGMARAMGLALLGDKLSAAQAEEWGLIWKSYEDENFEAEVEKLLTHFAAAPTRGLAETKRLLYASEGSSLRTQLDLERDGMRAMGETEDYRRGVLAFLDKQAPVFHGR